MVRKGALRTLLVLAALLATARGQANTRYDSVVQRFAALLERDEILPFNELASESVWFDPWETVRHAVLAYEGVHINSITIAEVRERVNGAEVDLRICGSGISDGRPNAPRQALPEQWTLTIDGRGKVAGVTAFETALARRIAAETSGEERCRLIATEPAAMPLLIPLLLPRARTTQIPGADSQASLAVGLAQRNGLVSAEIASWMVKAAIARLYGRYDDSLRYAQRAKALAQLSERPYDWERAAVAAGHALRTLELYDEAIREYDYAISLWGHIDLARTALEAELSIGTTARLRGEYAAAMEHYERVLRVAPELDLRESDAIGWMNIGGLYMEMNYDQAARTYLQLAIERMRALRSHNVPTALSNLAYLEKKFGNFDLAAQLLREALATPRAMPSVPGVLAAQSLATLHVHRGEMKEARELLEIALPASRQVAGKRVTAVVLRAQATLLVKEGNYEAAIGAATESLQILDEVNDIHTSIESRMQLALALFCTGDAPRAVDELRRAITDIERLPAPLSFDPEGRARFFDGKEEAYQHLTEILAEQGRLLEALETAEAMKARVLRSVHGGDPADAASLDPQERQRRKTIEDEIRDLNRQLAATTRGAERRLLEERLFRKRGELQEFFARLTTLHDRRAYVPAPDVVVPQGAVFVNFVVGPNTTTVLVTENRGGRMHFDRRLIAIPSKELEERVTKFTDALAKRDLAVDREGERLYRLLMAPIEPLMPRGATLCILPDGALWRIPFHALRTPRRGTYLIDEHPVFYAPSLRMLALARERQAPPHAKRLLVAFGVPTHAANGMPALPEAEQEVESLRDLYGAAQTRAFTGAAATESVFKREARAAQVLHIATHGIVDDSAPMYSALLFSQEPPASSEDGRLEAREVIDLDLGADIAVLSACDTARGHIGGGEGVIGLSWAFLVAGCPTTVVSHWKAESRTTKDVMTAFHAALLQGHSKVEALRIAQLRQRRNGHHHPFYWAPFVVLGSP